MRTTTVLLAALALVIAPAGLAGAQSDESNEPEVHASGSQATIEYNREVDDRRADVTITFETNSTQFGTELEVGNGTVARSNALNVQLHQLVEYEDHDEDGAYDEDEPIVSSYRLSEEAENVFGGPENGTVAWQDLNASQTTSDDGVPGHVVRGQGEFVGDTDPLGELEETLGQAENGTFAVSLYVFDDEATVNGTTIPYGQVKIDLTTKNYPYARNGTTLAMGLEASSERGLENASQGRNGVVVQDDIEELDAELLYTWASTAQVDGADRPAKTTNLSQASETERTFAISYERGEEIVHDPTTGISLSAADRLLDRAEDTASDVPGAGTLATAAVLGSLALGLAHRRRR